jgi:hypothetical protein
MPSTPVEFLNLSLFLDQFTVTPVFGNRTDWAAHFGFAGPFDSAFWLGDGDEDGRTTLEEYVFGGDPRASDQRLAFPAELGTIDVPLANPAGDVSIEALQSEDLAVWTPANASRLPDGTVRITHDSFLRRWFYRFRLTLL